MRTQRTRQILLAACVPALLLVATATTRANTVDIVHDSYGALRATTFWAAGHNGNDIMSGVYRLNKTSGTGTGNTWSNGLIPGFCIEIQEPHPTATYTYDVSDARRRVQQLHGPVPRHDQGELPAGAVGPAL